MWKKIFKKNFVKLINLKFHEFFWPTLFKILWPALCWYRIINVNKQFWFHEKKNYLFFLFVSFISLQVGIRSIICSILINSGLQIITFPITRWCSHILPMITKNLGKIHMKLSKRAWRVAKRVKMCSVHLSSKFQLFRNKSFMHNEMT